MSLRKKSFVKHIVDVGDEIEAASSDDLPFSTARELPGHDGPTIEDYVMRCGSSVPQEAGVPLYRIIPPSPIGR